jgi:hypothetical protein
MNLLHTKVHLTHLRNEQSDINYKFDYSYETLKVTFPPFSSSPHEVEGKHFKK